MSNFIKTKETWKNVRFCGKADFRMCIMMRREISAFRSKRSNHKFGSLKLAVVTGHNS